MDNHRTTGRAAEAARLLLSPRLMAICLAGSFMLVVGSVLSVSYLFVMAGTILSMPIVGYLIAARSLKHLSLTRSTPSVVQEGEEFSVTLTIHNRSLLPRYGLRVNDRLPKNIERVSSETEVLGVCSQDSETEIYQARAMRRGVYSLETAEVACEDLLGIFHVRAALRQPREILVFPSAARINLRDILLSQAREGIDRSAVRRADSAEIHGVREYYPGDELRRIHWPTSARAGELVVMELEERPGLQAVIAVDASPEFSEEDLDCPARLARGIADSLLESDAGVILFAGDQTAIAEGAHQAAEVYGALARMRPEVDQNLPARLDAAAPLAQFPVVIIAAKYTSRLIDDVRAIVNRGYPVTVLLSDSSASRGPDNAEKPLELVNTGARTLIIGCDQCGGGPK